MRPIRDKDGFTLVELLVTLVILGLTTSLVGPAVFTWLDSREAASRRNSLENTLSMLPLESLRQGQGLRIEKPEELGIQNIQGLRIDAPVIVLKNGYCKEGRISLTLGERVFAYQVLPPFCEVALIDNE